MSTARETTAEVVREHLGWAWQMLNDGKFSMFKVGEYEGVSALLDSAQFVSEATETFACLMLMLLKKHGVWSDSDGDRCRDDANRCAALNLAISKLQIASQMIREASNHIDQCCLPKDEVLKVLGNEAFVNEFIEREANEVEEVEKSMNRSALNSALASLLPTDTTDSKENS